MEVLEHGRNGTDTKPARFANNQENDEAAKYYVLHAFNDRDRYSSDMQGQHEAWMMELMVHTKMNKVQSYSKSRVVD
jgi:hypothetical protein